MEAISPTNITRKNRYPVIGKKKAIEIRVRSLAAIFDEKDPAPFLQKDLNANVAEYLIDSAADISISHLDQIFIFSDEPAHQLVSPDDAVAGIGEFFEYETQKVDRKIRNTLRLGLKALLIGFIFLNLAVGVSMLIPEKGGSYSALLGKEGLLLLGWVSMWKPINIFLYDWWPLVDRKQVFKKLAEVPIKIIFSK